MAQDEVKSSLGMHFHSHLPAGDAQEVHARHEANRLAWNEGAAHYTARLGDTLAFLRAGGSNLQPIERTNLGALRAWCATAIHLQCAWGEDTLSLGWRGGHRRGETKR